VKESHFGILLAQRFIPVAISVGDRGGVEKGESARAASIVSHAQEQGAAARRHVLARLVTDLDRRNQNSKGTVAARPSPGFAPEVIAAAGVTSKLRMNYGGVMSLESFPRYPLMFGPSPIHRLYRLTEYLEGATVWAKRDDVNSPLAFGGNKTRKLEYLVADALASGCDTLVSIGGVQSNHTRQVAAAAAKTGMKCVLIQESWVDWPDVTYDRVGNILLSRLMGADVRLVRAGFGIGFKESWERAILDIEDGGGKPYAIPAGASDHPLGGLGFAGWAEEVEQQEAELGVVFDYVVVCSVTGGTQAGMIAGFAQSNDPRTVIGIDGSAKPEETWAQIARIARATAKLIGVERDIADEEIILDDRFHAGTYGIPDQRTLEAMRLGASMEAMITDPVYEGKSLAGLIHMVLDREIPPDANVLFAHLGGQPALNAYASLFQ
jgi:1-aminocyclopropane-1-carboxylate deaminase